MKTLIAATFLFLLGNVALADGFNVDGYFQGMTFDAAEKLAAKRDLRLTFTDINTEPVKNYSLNRPTDNKTLYSLAFCNNQLVFISQYIDKGMATFVELSKNFESQGYSVLSASTKRLVTNDGSVHSSIEHVLFNPKSTYSISLSLSKFESFAESLSIAHQMYPWTGC